MSGTFKFKGMYSEGVLRGSQSQIKKSSGASALTPDAAAQLGPKAVELQRKKAKQVDVPNFVKTVKKEEVELGERHMTSAERRKEEALGKKTGSAKAAMKKEYGPEKGEQIYYAWKRKQAMSEYISIDEAKKEKKMKGEDPCWKGYEMIGKKKKNGREVPNCVPEEIDYSDAYDYVIEALVDAEFAEDYETAENMFECMSDEFVSVILEEYIEEAKLSRAERRAANAGRKGYNKEGKPVPTGKPRVYDFDKVTADTAGTNVHIKNAKGERVQSLNDTQFYTHHKNKELEKGHSYDFSDFDSPKVLAKNAKPIKSTIASMKRDQRRNKPVMTLTARSHKVKSGVTGFLNKHGVDASKVKQHFTGDMPSHLNTGERKAITLRHIVKNNPAGAKFTDDHRGNLESAREVPKVKTFLAKPNKRGEVVSRSYQATKEDFELWVNALIDEGYDLSEFTIDELYEEFLDEASTVVATAAPEPHRPKKEFTSPYKNKKLPKKEYKKFQENFTPYEFWMNIIEAQQPEATEEVVEEEIDEIVEEGPTTSYDYWKRHIEENANFSDT